MEHNSLESLGFDFGQWEFISIVLSMSNNQFRREKLEKFMVRSMGFN